MRKTLFILGLAGMFMCVNAQVATTAQKEYEREYGNFCVNRDSFQRKQQWDSSIVVCRKMLNDTVLGFLYYRLAVNYASLHQKDSAYNNLHRYIDISADDRAVVVDPAFEELRKDSIKWQQVLYRIEQGYLDCLDSSYNFEWALKLFYLGIEDQKYRFYYSVWHEPWEGDQWYDLEVAKEQQFKNLFAQYGFPTISKVGKHASQAAFTLIQHGSPCRQYYSAVKQAYNNHDFLPAHYAKVIDRWRAEHRKRQLYGTSWIKSNKTKKKYGDVFILEPVRDFKNLNKRRFELGLPSIEDRKKTLGDDYLIPDKYYK
jgi:hypothetical protein